MRRASLAALALCLLLPLLSRADDPEPPNKGGPLLRQLRGKWVAVAMKVPGKEGKTPPGGMTYHFDGEKVTVKFGKTEFVAKVKVNAKKKPTTIELIREDGKTTIEYAVKIDQGMLLLAPTRSFKGEVDFNGNNNPVLVLKREKDK